MIVAGRHALLEMPPRVPKSAALQRHERNPWNEEPKS